MPKLQTDWAPNACSLICLFVGLTYYHLKIWDTTNFDESNVLDIAGKNLTGFNPLDLMR